MYFRVKKSARLVIPDWALILSALYDDLGDFQTTRHCPSDRVHWFFISYTRHHSIPIHTFMSSYRHVRDVHAVNRRNLHGFDNDVVRFWQLLLVVTKLLQIVIILTFCIVNKPLDFQLKQDGFAKHHAPVATRSGKKIKVCLWNTDYALGGNKVQKSYFQRKGQSQGHKVIDLGVSWKGIISTACMPNMKSLPLTVQKL